MRQPTRPAIGRVEVCVVIWAAIVGCHSAPALALAASAAAPPPAAAAGEAPALAPSALALLSPAAGPGFERTGGWAWKSAQSLPGYVRFVFSHTSGAELRVRITERVAGQRAFAASRSFAIAHEGRLPAAGDAEGLLRRLVAAAQAADPGDQRLPAANAADAASPGRAAAAGVTRGADSASARVGHPLAGGAGRQATALDRVQLLIAAALLVLATLALGLRALPLALRTLWRSPERPWLLLAGLAAVAARLLAEPRLVSMFMAYRQADTALAFDVVPRYGAGVHVLHAALLRLGPVHHLTLNTAHTLCAVLTLPVLAALAARLQPRRWAATAALLAVGLTPLFIRDARTESNLVPIQLALWSGGLLWSRVLVACRQDGINPKSANPAQLSRSSLDGRAKPARGGAAQLAGLGRAPRAPQNERQDQSVRCRACTALDWSRQDAALTWATRIDAAAAAALLLWATVSRPELLVVAPALVVALTWGTRRPASVRSARASEVPQPPTGTGPATQPNPPIVTVSRLALGGLVALAIAVVAPHAWHVVAHGAELHDGLRPLRWLLTDMFSRNVVFRPAWFPVGITALACLGLWLPARQPRRVARALAIFALLWGATTLVDLPDISIPRLFAGSATAVTLMAAITAPTLVERWQMSVGSSSTHAAAALVALLAVLLAVLLAASVVGTMPTVWRATNQDLEEEVFRHVSGAIGDLPRAKPACILRVGDADRPDPGAVHRYHPDYAWRAAGHRVFDLRQASRAVAQCGEVFFVQGLRCYARDRHLPRGSGLIAGCRELRRSARWAAVWSKKTAVRAEDPFGWWQGTRQVEVGVFRL